MTEPGLFYAYRSVKGYRTQCACRGWIEAHDEKGVPEAVEFHNATAEHLLWRCEQDAVEALRRRPTRICTCHGRQGLDA